MASDSQPQDPQLTAKLESSFETTGGRPVSRAPGSHPTDTSVRSGVGQAAAAAKEERARPQIPDVLLEQMLGQGGMGAVFRGRQITLDRAVAVKVIHGDLAKEASFVKRFEREAKVLAKLSHPNIVACYQAGRAATGEHYLLMEFVEGQDLRQRVEREGNVGEVEALVLVRQVADALAHALELGIIHRDVKPENILLKAASKTSSAGAQAKLVDLGLASLARPGTNEAARITEAGTAVGTPVTMAPEQAEEPDSIDHRADIYALGCTLYYAVTGHFPHEGGTVPQVIAKKLRGETPSPKTFRPDLSAPIVDLILRMVALAPGDRPASYDVLVDEIDAAIATMPHAAGLKLKNTSTRALAATMIEPSKSIGAGGSSGGGGLRVALALAVLAALAVGGIVALRTAAVVPLPPTPTTQPTTPAIPSPPTATPPTGSPTPATPDVSGELSLDPPLRAWKSQPKLFNKDGDVSLDGWTQTPARTWLHDSNGDVDADVFAVMKPDVELTKIVLDAPTPAEWVLGVSLFPETSGIAGVWVETEDGPIRFAVATYASQVALKLDTVKDGRPLQQDGISEKATLKKHEPVELQVEFADNSIWACRIGHEGTGRDGKMRPWVRYRVGKPALHVGLFATNVSGTAAAAAFTNVHLDTVQPPK